MTNQTAYIGLGSNLDRPAERVLEAAGRLEHAAGIQSLELSPLYESPPWGIAHQPDFINAAARVRTSLTAEDLLALCQRTEREMGRAPTTQKWGPRRIDLDILLYGNAPINADIQTNDSTDPQLTDAQLIVPHPRLAERLFVLQPLLDLNPDLRHPQTHQPLSALLAALPRTPGDLAPCRKR